MFFHRVRQARASLLRAVLHTWPPRNVSQKHRPHSRRRRKRTVVRARADRIAGAVSRKPHPVWWWWWRWRWWGVVSSLLIIFGPTDSRNAVGTIHHGDGRSTGFSLLYGPGVGGEDSFKKLLISKRTSHYVSFKILFSCEQGRRNKRGGGGGGGGGGDIPT